MCLLFARSSKLACPDYVPGLRGHARFCQLLRVGGAEVGLARDHESHGVLRLLEGLVVLLPSLEDVLGDAVKVRVQERTWGKYMSCIPLRNLNTQFCLTFLAILVERRYRARILNDLVDFCPGQVGRGLLLVVGCRPLRTRLCWADSSRGSSSRRGRS